MKTRRTPKSPERCCCDCSEYTICDACGRCPVCAAKLEARRAATRAVIAAAPATIIGYDGIAEIPTTTSTAGYSETDTGPDPAAGSEDEGC